MRVIGQAKDWMLLYAEAEIRPILQSAPALDRPASRALVARLYPQHQLTEIADGTLFEQANPDDDRIYAGCFPGLTVACTGDASLDQPSQLGQRFLREARGRRLYLHAMHCVVDWFAYAIWDTDGTLVRALSLSPMSGIVEDVGPRLDFEKPYWSGQQPLAAGGGDYPFPFHPLELGEVALRTLFGFNYEGLYRHDDPDLERIALAGFAIQPTLGS